MRRTLLALSVVAALASPAHAQDTVLRVEYVDILIAADGTEWVVGGGTHFISSDGRHRHDLTRRSEELSYYRLPAEGVVVAVHHALRVGIRTPLGNCPWNPSTKVWFSPARGKVKLVGMLDRDLGQRAHGPMLLHGVAGDRIEQWVYRPPLVATDPIMYPPITLESTMLHPETGEKSITRITTVERIPMTEGLFAVPYGRPEVEGPHRLARVR